MLLQMHILNTSHLLHIMRILGTGLHELHLGVELSNSDLTFTDFILSDQPYGLGRRRWTRRLKTPSHDAPKPNLTVLLHFFSCWSNPL